MSWRITFAFLSLLALGRCLPAQETVVPSSRPGEQAQQSAKDKAAGIPATLSLAEIRTALERAHHRLRSLFAELRSTNVPRVGTDWVHTVVAAKGRCRSLWFEHIRDVDDPLARFSFYNGKCFNVYYPYDRLYEVSQRFACRPYTDKVRCETFFEILAWWPPDDPSVPPQLGDHHFFLKELLAHEPCRVRPFQEIIDDRRCHVIEVPGLDTLWIDAAAGILVRRERLAGDPPRPSVTYELQDYREIAPGLLLPFRMQRTLHYEGSRKTLHEVLRYEVNAVADSQFTFAPGPGTLVHDRDTDTGYQVPGGLDLLETIRDRVRARLDAPPEKKRFWLGQSIRLFLFSLGSAGVYGIFRFVPFLYHRRRRPCQPTS